MDTTVVKILTQREPKGCHVESEVTISWTGVTQEQLYKLAQIALIHHIQSKIKRKIIKGEALEKIRISAAEAVHEPTYCLIEFAPRAKVSKPSGDVTDDQFLNELLKNLSPEDIERLLK